MKIFGFSNAFIIYFSLIFSSCSTDEYGGSNYTDWLISGEKYVSEILQSPDGKEMTISNGLIERSFRLTPNFATVGLNNLTTGESYLRSVRPEARISLNGKKLDIGGLTGQPIHNYLLADWIESLTNDEEAFQFVNYSIEEIKPRFDWKIRKDWLPGDVSWPPKGKELIVTFKAPEGFSKVVQYEKLYSDNFTALDKDWQVFSSTSNERNSFSNEGKPGGIMADENVPVYAEREFPLQATGIQSLIHPGTDQSTSWGPGIAMVFKDKTIKLNLQPGLGTFGLWDGEKEEKLGKLKEGLPYHLGLRIFNNHIICEFSEDGSNWEELSRIYCADRPDAIRIGKMDRSGGISEGRSSGKTERSQIRHFSILGPPIQDQMESSLLEGLIVKVHYEIYDGIPLISKWISLENNSENSVKVDSFVSEILATVEAESSVEGESRWELPNLHVETDFAFSSMSNRKANSAAVHWKTDSIYTSQVNYALKTPCLLEIHPEIGPAQNIAVGGDFSSFRAWELFYDSHDKERKGLATRKMYRTIAPWVTENPILMHVRNADPESVKLAIDQSAQVGFEMVIMTFGSGFNMETGDPEYYEKMKELADYAHDKGIALGGYSLLASRSVSAEADIINPATGKPGGIAYFGNSPCLAGEWGEEYFRKIKEMYEETGLDIIEHDGSYPGDICGSSIHPGHVGLEDSQWNQYRIISEFYQWCRSQGIYLNVPDWYYLNGSSKCAMGYREVNWSLPRAQQEIIERQNIYDGTWTKTPSMGWMFVPLTQYHGGGAAATIEPLSEHLEHYSQRMANLFGAGVQACYRGPRLFDTDDTRMMVKNWVDFYKNHRQILDSDIVHLRRPDGKDWDGILHVNPEAEEKGFLMLYNPLEKSISRELSIPVYYTGLSKTALFTDDKGKKNTYPIDRQFNVKFEVELPAKGYRYFILN